MNVIFLLSVYVSFVCGLKPLESDDIIHFVNEAETTWKAGRNFDSKLTSDHIKHLCGLKRKVRSNTLPEKAPVEVGAIPKTFDARTQWPNCQALQEVRDQGHCGSCWAVSCAAAFTDRLCIASNGSFNGHLSSQDILSCCTNCGDGCKGGSSDDAWKYLEDYGIVTGGDYGSNEGCQPYTIQPCEHFVHGTLVQCTSLPPTPTPKCEKECKNETINYYQDRHKVSSAYTLTNVKQIQKDIMSHGPIGAGFKVYEDFVTYKSGVYQHTTGDFLALHAVKVIGWGVENKVPYWLVANTWNSDWGDKGFFKIKRGSDECEIESHIFGGVPIV